MNLPEARHREPDLERQLHLQVLARSGAIARVEAEFTAIDVGPDRA